MNNIINGEIYRFLRYVFKEILHFIITTLIIIFDLSSKGTMTSTKTLLIVG